VIAIKRPGTFSTFFVFLLFLGACTTNDSPEASAGEPADSNHSKSAVPPKPDEHSGIVRHDSILSAVHQMNLARFGDFDSLLKRRMIRVLIPFGRTLYFNDKGRERGITADTFRDFETYLNKKYKRKLRNIPVTVLFVPTTRDKLISRLNEGMGDIAAGNLMVTDERLKAADFFSSPDEQVLTEIPLTKTGTRSLTDVEQLSGKTVHVRLSSSYYEHLLELNKRLSAKGKAPVTVVAVSENLENEDLMEMLDAGILSIIIVDSWMARMWAPILPGIQLNEGAPLFTGGRIGWAIRKNSPALIAELTSYYKEFVQRNGVVPYRMKRYTSRIKQLQDPTSSDNYKRYAQVMQLFDKYGKVYAFDPLMLAALGFQESQLDQKRRSHVGAVGVMQLMPRTGASMKVGNIYVTEPNIHAGSKYMKQLTSVYFKDAHFNAFNRALFAVASYNAGPARVAALRRVALSRGLDPDVWLDNVEIIASEKIGQETTTYVRNILKYYYSYKLMEERQKVQEQHRGTKI
jgi:membrane-bound lytic murein transglycosylase MltF